KSSNVDCTFCLDCVHACPRDNVAIAPTTPGAELVRDPQRSGLGRFSRRYDLAALVLVVVFGAFANASLMTGPAVELQDRVASSTGGLVATTLVFAALMLVPLGGFALAAVVSRRLETAARNAFGLVPLGVGVWLAHYGYHFLTSWTTIVPATQRF